MQLLWVKAGKLLPVDTGGKIRSYHLLRQLAAGHEVTLLSYYGGRRDPGYDAEIARHFPLAVTVHTGAPDGSPAAVALDYARHAVSSAPYAVTKFTSPRVSRLITSWFHERRFDVAVCDFLSASLNFPATLSTPSVLFQHNVELVARQFAAILARVAREDGAAASHRHREPSSPRPGDALAPPDRRERDRQERAGT